jgi:hypothetical protein
MEVIPSPLFKFYDERRWAERFFAGELLCWSVSYYRDLEDEIRGDENEGYSEYRPQGGLVINNITQGTSFCVPDSAMLSAVKQDEIFAFCMSTSSDAVVANQLGETFVEILDGPQFVRRVRAALPENAKFFSRAVEYYDASDPPGARWAVPEFISTAKQRSPKYVSQAEYRLVFSLTDALEFEKVSLSITTGQAQPAPRRNSYPNYIIKSDDLSDICRLRGA